jgi:hypothetical protein
MLIYILLLSYYSVFAVLAEYGWYRYYVLVRSVFLCLFLFVYTIMWGVEGVQTITYILLCATTLCLQSWQSMVGTGTTCWCVVFFCVYFYLFIPLCGVLKGSKPLPSIRTKLHAELHTTLCVQSWQNIVGTSTTCWWVGCFCFYLYLIYYYVWCWRGPNHYPLYKLNYMGCLSTTLCVQFGRVWLVPVLRVGA